VLGHQNVSIDPGRIDPGPMTRPHLFQHGLDGVPGIRRGKERKTVKTTERDEVKRLGFLEPLQAVGHGPIVIERSLTR